MVDRMISAFESIEKITYIVVIALVLVTVFLIINTIKLTISARSREISIMRLVGASNITIKLPFIIEGMILGALGSIVPILFTTYGLLKRMVNLLLLNNRKNFLLLILLQETQRS